MRNPNFLKKRKNDEEEPETTWESLRHVPFAGEQNSPTSIKGEITKKVEKICNTRKRGVMTARDFMFVLVDGLQPILARSGSESLYNDYDFWKGALGEAGPILAVFWAECDPMIISYLFMIFVAQFLVLLRLWEKIDFAEYCEHDCAKLGEFFLTLNTVQEEMLVNISNKWGIRDGGRPNHLDV